MSRIGCVWVFVVLVVMGGCSNEPSYRLADGDAISLSELHGDWVVINYWAEWCAPCREEIPELNELGPLPQNKALFFRYLALTMTVCRVTIWLG
ncbi:MAG: hypothetical protein CM15mP68_1060 [Pseudomonadota bacterium]|nr:MAG: hypothetical protein CM15mP68_1060 [Pseudomonadota bacterium]